MKKIYLFIIATAATVAALSSCEKSDEVPPVQKTAASTYQMPDPEPLTAEDRAVISAQEAEYNQNAK